MNTDGNPNNDSESARPDAFDDFASRLAKRLRDPLPGREGHLRMAPRYRADPGLLSIEGKRCTEAGVLVLLVPSDPTPGLLLTVRRPDLNHHAGQVSFPGGRREEGENLEEAALRECYEEVAIDPASVDVLGALSPLYIPPSRFCVHPYVGVTRTTHYRPDPAEVDRVLVAPITHFLDASRHCTGTRWIGETEHEVPYFDIGGEMVWGATAMMIAEFALVVSDVL